MRMILLHEYGHTKYPAYFHLVMKILYVVAGIFCALLYLLYVSLSITIIQLTVISFVVGVTFINILFFRLKHYLEQDEYNADFWAAWAFTQLFDGKASEVLNDTLIELEKIKMEYYSNNKYQAWISSVKTKLSGHLDPHPNVDDRVKYIQNWFQE
jgi:Zn-dependent protease with chaperone function